MLPAMRNAKGQYEASTQQQAEAEALRLMVLAGSAYDAMKGSEMRGDNSRVLSVLKAAAPAATTSSGADVLAPVSFPGFQAALRTSSVFDSVAGEAMEVNFHAKVGMLANQLSGGKVASGAAKLSQTLFFTQNTLSPVKLVSLLAVTQEFLQNSPGAMESLLTQLRIAVGGAADLEFLTQIAATNSDVASSPGSGSMADIMADIVQLLGSLDYAQASRLWLVVDQGAARSMMAAAYSVGAAGMGPTGGTFAGLRVLVSDSLPSSTISAIDSMGLAVAASPVTVKTSDETSLALADSSAMSAATGTAANVTSMFQTNSVGLMAERSIAFAPLRPNAFASLTSVGWAGSVDSPLP